MKLTDRPLAESVGNADLVHIVQGGQSLKATRQMLVAGLEGLDGANGADGVDGLSAYQVWLGAGNTGTEQDYLNSLIGAQGPQGEIGPQGEAGEDGNKVFTATSAQTTLQGFIDTFPFMTETPSVAGQMVLLNHNNSEDILVYMYMGGTNTIVDNYKLTYPVITPEPYRFLKSFVQSDTGDPNILGTAFVDNIPPGISLTVIRQSLGVFLVRFTGDSSYVGHNKISVKMTSGSSILLHAGSALSTFNNLPSYYVTFKNYDFTGTLIDGVQRGLLDIEFFNG